MPTREQTIADAIRVFENAEFPVGQDANNAWLGIYQTLLWHEPVNWLGINKLPHIIEADKLRPSTPVKERSWTSLRIWQRRAQSIELYLSSQLRCQIADLPDKTDLLMKQPSYEGMQRQNTLGIAFVGLIKHILEQYGSREMVYETEVDPSVIFAGITFPGRSETPRIDLLARRANIPCVIISAKWSIRHDRLNDITNECPVYKAAYERIYRGSGQDHLRYYVMTNEYDPARLTKILNDTCVDGVVHVHKKAIVEICSLDGRLDRLIDLADFVAGTLSW